MNNKRKKLIKLVGEIGGYMVNGVVERDEEGEFTYVGPRSSSVIDYIIVNEACYDNVNSFKVVSRVESDHMSIVMETRGERRKNKRRKGEEGEMKSSKKKEYKYCWSKKATKVYNEKTDNTN